MYKQVGRNYYLSKKMSLGTRIILTIIFQWSVFSIVLGQEDSLQNENKFDLNTSNVRWQCPPNDFFSSYGSACDILVFQDHIVVRDILLIKPSILFNLNKCEQVSKLDKMVIQFVIKENKGFYQIEVESMRLFQNNELINDSNIEDIIENCLIKNSVESLKVSGLRKFYSFGLVFIKKPN